MLLLSGCGPGGRGPSQQATGTGSGPSVAATGPGGAGGRAPQHLAYDPDTGELRPVSAPSPSTTALADYPAPAPGISSGPGAGRSTATTRPTTTTRPTATASQSTKVGPAPSLASGTTPTAVAVPEAPEVPRAPTTTTSTSRREYNKSLPPLPANRSMQPVTPPANPPPTPSQYSAIRPTGTTAYVPPPPAPAPAPSSTRVTRADPSVRAPLTEQPLVEPAPSGNFPEVGPPSPVPPPPEPTRMVTSSYSKHNLSRPTQRPVQTTQWASSVRPAPAPVRPQVSRPPSVPDYTPSTSTTEKVAASTPSSGSGYKPRPRVRRKPPTRSTGTDSSIASVSTPSRPKSRPVRTSGGPRPSAGYEAAPVKPPKPDPVGPVVQPIPPTPATNMPPLQEPPPLAEGLKFAGNADVPSQATEGQTFEVVLRLNKDSMGSDLGSSGSTPQIDGLDATRTVMAEIPDSPDYQVLRDKPPKQELLESYPPEWRWQVKPLKPGPLDIRIDLKKVSESENTASEVIKTYAKTVHVAEAPKPEAPKSSFPWLWFLLGAGGLGGAGAAWYFLFGQKPKSNVEVR